MSRYLKPTLQYQIRSIHTLLMDRGLPDRIAVCLHSLEPTYYAAFEEMVRFFQERAYRFVHPGEFLSVSPEKRVLLSFDDSYRSWYTARPLFDDLNVRATFYTNTCAFRDQAGPAEIGAYFGRLGYRGKTSTLSTGELLALDADGHTIAAHSHAHFNLASLPQSTAQDEIWTSKIVLEELLGKPVLHFSHPYGMRRYFTDGLRHYCREIGFDTVANAISGRQHAEQTALDLNRSVWDLRHSLHHNVQNLSADGRCFELLTGRSAVG